MYDTMTSSPGTKGGAGSHKETVLAGIAHAYKMGTGVQGPYFQSPIISDSRAGNKPQHTYKTTSSAGGAPGGPLENMLASYTQNHTMQASNSYERMNTNKSQGYSRATYLGEIKLDRPEENTTNTLYK